MKTEYEIVMVKPRLEIRKCGSFWTISCDNFGVMEHLTIPNARLGRVLVDMTNAFSVHDVAGPLVSERLRKAKPLTQPWEESETVMQIQGEGVIGSIRLTEDQIREVTNLLVRLS